MISTDVTRALVFLAAVIVLSVWMNARNERRRDQRRFQLHEAAMAFSNALADFVEETK